MEINKLFVSLIFVTVVSISACTQQPGFPGYQPGTQNNTTPSTGAVVENYVFNGGTGSCASQGSNSATIERFANSVIQISGQVLTPNPCHELVANYTVEKGYNDIDVITINILPEGRGEACVSCVGLVPFTGSFRANTQKFSIIITYEGQVIGQKSFINL